MFLSLLIACKPSSSTAAGGTADAAGGGGLADVTAVSTSGSEEEWSFSVTISSPDIGCDGYADWWEVLDAAGALQYRRILNHSHTDEQPFTRSGSPVPVGADEEVVVRAHMSPGGYGGMAMRGSVSGGFVEAADITAGFAAAAEDAEPQPSGCAF